MRRCQVPGTRCQTMDGDWLLGAGSGAERQHVLRVLQAGRCCFAQATAGAARLQKAQVRPENGN